MHNPRAQPTARLSFPGNGSPTASQAHSPLRDSDDLRLACKNVRPGLTGENICDEGAPTRDVSKLRRKNHRPESSTGTRVYALFSSRMGGYRYNARSAVRWF